VFLERDNVLELEDVEEELGRGGRGGAREYAGGLSAGSELGKDFDLSRASLGGERIMV